MGSNIIQLRSIFSSTNLTVYLKPGEMAALYEYGEDDIGYKNTSSAPQFAFEVTNDYIADPTALSSMSVIPITTTKYTVVDIL
jgi:hypothetical protein